MRTELMEDVNSLFICTRLTLFYAWTAAAPSESMNVLSSIAISSMGCFNADTFHHPPSTSDCIASKNLKCYDPKLISGRSTLSTLVHSVYSYTLQRRVRHVLATSTKRSCAQITYKETLHNALLSTWKFFVSETYRDFLDRWDVNLTRFFIGMHEMQHFHSEVLWSY